MNRIGKVPRPSGKLLNNIFVGAGVKQNDKLGGTRLLTCPRLTESILVISSSYLSFVAISKDTDGHIKDSSLELLFPTCLDGTTMLLKGIRLS